MLASLKTVGCVPFLLSTWDGQPTYLFSDILINICHNPTMVQVRKTEKNTFYQNLNIFWRSHLHRRTILPSLVLIDIFQDGTRS